MSSEKLEELNLSIEEIKRISDAMKDEKFRKLFVEYAEEISNPENKRLYEEELTKLESENGVNVTFVNPLPGYVLKTSQNGKQKAFINICQSDKIDKPVGKRETDGSKTGLMWHIPHSFAPPREDLDKSGTKCQIYDVVFHPDTYRMAETSPRFKNLVEETAIDGIEQQFSVKLDRVNIKRPKMKFKGTPTATVIRTKNSSAAKSDTSSDDFLKNLPSYPYDKKPDSGNSESKIVEEKNKKNASTNSSKPTTPKYSIIHRSELDLQEFTNNQGAKKTSTRPKELVITIELPLLKSAASADLDVFEKRLVLESTKPAAYKLDIALPYPVNDSEGSAKFDKVNRSLTITLPVLADKSPINSSSQISSDSTHSNDENLGTETKPLIEVLEPQKHLLDESSAEVPELGKTLSYPESVTPLEETKQQNFPSIVYNMPDFTFTQDTETVNFVLNVRNVSTDTIVKTFPTSSTVSLQFMSLGSGCFPMHYSLYIEFPEDCQIATDHCSVDVSTTTVVLLVLKSKDCRRLWNSFKSGVDNTSLKDQLFLTESYLQAELDKLDRQANDQIQPLDKAELTVTEMTQKKLTIKLQKLSVREEDEEYDTPLSADIEVIHNSAPPKLHSILKQRTISESSDDYLLSPSSESPRSDEDSCKLNKSVSFNNRVDSTHFQSSKCPQSVKTTLHNKRKKQRRKENLKQQRAERHRNNSTGSEYSSGDDISDTHSHSDTPVNDDFEKIYEENEDVSEEVAKLAHAISKGFTESPPSKPKVNKTSDENSVLQTKSESENVKKDGVAASTPLDFRTSGKKRRNRGKGKGNKAYQGVSKCDRISTTSTDSSDNFEESKNYTATSKDEVLINPSNDVDDSIKDIPKNEAQLETFDKLKTAVTPTDTAIADQESKLQGVTCDAGSISAPGDLKNIVERSDSSVVKIVAGEREEQDSDDDVEGEKPSSLSTLTNNEHKTQCAFQFSNSVIYDLDND